MSNNFKRAIDRQMWVQVPPSPNSHAAGAGLASDLRNDLSRNPFIYQLTSNTALNRYNLITKAWNFVVSPALAGTYGSGAGCVFAPSHGLFGCIGNGCTTSSIVTTTVITAVAPNMLANRGGSGEHGFRVRITGYSAGKTEERWIVGNTGGTTPTLSLDTPLTFTPVNGDTFEILAGRIFMLGAGTLAAGSFKSFELSTNTLSLKTQTGLPTTIGTDFSALALDELYVPFDRKPGEGFLVGTGTYDTSGIVKNCLIATASASSAITGQATNGDASVLANEYRNFQIRIVEDTVTPAAVGQRRIISSHTAGPSSVYTLSTAWSATPSSNAKFVIEYPNVIILRSSASASTYVYNYGLVSLTSAGGTVTITPDAWNTSYFGVTVAHGAGVTMFPSFGIQPDAGKNARHSFIYMFRGGNSSFLDVLDIAGGNNGSVSTAITYDGSSMATPNTGTSGKYAPVDNNGRFGYMNVYVASQVNQMYRFDVKNRVLSTATPTDWIQSGTATTGDRIAALAAIDGTDKYTVLLLISHLSNITQELIVQT